MENISKAYMAAASSLLLALSALGGAAAAPLAAGNFQHGKQLYEECKGCHAVNTTLVGPKHCGVYGRKAGSVEGYLYSDVMKKSGITWDDAHLDAFLKSPFTYFSGTNMGYIGLDSAQDRADVIAYLKQALDPAMCDATEAEQKAEQKTGGG